MATVKWKKSEIVNDRYAMARLQYLAEFQKETLLGLIKADLLLKDLQRSAMLGWETLKDQETNPYLGAGGAEELALEAATSNGELPKEPDDWTKAEWKLVLNWWKKTFPGEENPLY